MELELALNKKLTLDLPAYGIQYWQPIGNRKLFYKIHLTFGGGMGGGSSTIYSPFVKEEEKYFNIRNILTSQNMKIFPNNIVSITETYVQKFLMKYSEDDVKENYAHYDIGMTALDNIVFRKYDSNRPNPQLIYYFRSP